MLKLADCAGVAGINVKHEIRFGFAIFTGARRGSDVVIKPRDEFLLIKQ